MLKISRYQLFSMFSLFEIGSTTLYALAIKADQDAWIGLLFAMAGGFVYLLLASRMQEYFPLKNLTEIIISIIGKPLGYPLVFLYSLLFFFLAARTVREFGELLKVTFLPRTPMTVVIGLFLIALFYILYLGLDTFVRTSEMSFPLILMFLLSSLLLVAISGRINLTQLLPVMPEGLKPIISKTFIDTINFPFTQVFVFSTLWHYYCMDKRYKKTIIWAYMLSGIVIIASSVVYISVLGATFAAAATIPLLEVIKLINIGDFLTNLDSFAVIIMFSGGFFKAVIYMFGSTELVLTAFKIKNPRWFYAVSCLLLVWFSIIFEPNYPFHTEMAGKLFFKYLQSPFHLVIPPLLLATGAIKIKLSSMGKNNKKKPENFKEG